MGERLVAPPGAMTVLLGLPLGADPGMLDRLAVVGRAWGVEVSTPGIGVLRLAGPPQQTAALAEVARRHGLGRDEPDLACPGCGQEVPEVPDE